MSIGNVGPYLTVLLILIGLMAVLIITGSIGEKKDWFTGDRKKFSAWFKIAIFAVFMLIGFAMIPVVIYFFTEKLGDVITESDFPAFLKANSLYMVFIIWAIYLAGLYFSLPAAIKDGFFSDEEDPEQIKKEGN